MYRRKIAFASIIATLLAILCATAVAQYELTNLVSNQSGQALHHDPLLINAWGRFMARAAHGGSATTARAGRLCTATQ
ncbi:MAG TPA: hypothetical protein VF772_09695, partial [Terriglobales bacterium]